tara:strand:- start:1176 stop:2186 length:1011 start_codon:yes stop_codon:yes gene_type:complete
MSVGRGTATHEPTVKRLQKARDEGNVARSSDLATALFLVVGVAVVAIWIPKCFAFSKALLMTQLSGTELPLQVLLEQAGWGVFELALFPCLVFVLAGVFSGIVQVGGLFTPGVASAQLSRIAFTGTRKIVGPRGQMQMLFSITKLLLAAGASLLVLLHYKEQLLSLGTKTDILTQVRVVGSIAVLVVVAALTVLFMLGIADFCWQRYAWKSDLKMTRQELIDEHKENASTSGLRRKTTWLAKKSVDQAIPSIVVVGDTIAVAIRWNAITMSFPVVIDMYQGEDFAEYTESTNGAPVVTDNSLADRIVRLSDVGLGIPPTLHGEIASLLLASRRVTV